MITPHEYKKRHKPRCISYVVSSWPNVPKDPAKRIRAKCYPQDENVPKWALAYEWRVRLAANEAFGEFNTANNIEWSWRGHTIVIVKIFMPTRTSVDIDEVAAIINRVNADLFYDSRRATHEINVIPEYDNKNPRIECVVFRSIIGQEAWR